MQPPSLRIALFTYSTKPRGSVIHTLELANALHQLGHEVWVYALDKDGDGFDYSLSCNYTPVPAKPAPLELDALIQQRIEEFVDYLDLSRLTYDIYHAQDCISANALAILVHRQQIPHFIRTVHHIEDYTSVYLQQCQDRSIRQASLCLCVSHHWQVALQQHYQIDASRVINGVNLARFSPIPNGQESVLKDRWRLHGSPIYLTIGGIEPRKNSVHLLQAFQQVLTEYPQAQLVIAGGSTVFDYHAYRDDFFALARLSTDIGSSLILPGVIADAELAALYRTADAFVFPSIIEGWGLVVLEAIASGLPVITANQTPFTEFLSPTQALLVDPQSPTSIAHAMRSIAQPNCAQSLLNESQQVLPHYTWEASAKMHLTHYQTLLGADIYLPLPTLN